MKSAVWLYPRRWRRRYGEEFVALIEERGFSLSAALDVVRGALRAIELSVAEANGLRHHYMGTEHLLLGLFAQEQGIAVDVLRERNVGNLAELRSDIMRVLNSGGLQT